MIEQATPLSLTVVRSRDNRSTPDFKMYHLLEAHQRLKVTS